MKRLVASLIFCAIFISTAAQSKSPEHLLDDNLLVLENLTLIDGTDNSPLQNACVIIKDSLIFRVGKTGDFIYPKNAKVVSLQGRYLVPGFINVHVHIQTPIHKEVLQMLLAYGITSIRVPGGTDVGIEVRRKINNGEMMGPDVFTGGRLIDGEGSHNFGVTTESDIREEIQRQHKEGVDLIKLYSGITPQLLAAGIDEAHKLGIPVVGHLSKTSWTEAAESGIDGLLHSGSGGPLGELISQKHRTRLASALSLTEEEFIEKSRNLGFLLELAKDSIGPAGQVIYNLIDINGAEVNHLIQSLLENNVMVDPTLVTEESLVYGDEVERVLSNLDPYNTPKSVRNFLWGEDWETGNRILRGANKDIFLSFKPLLKLAKELTLKFYEEGVVLGAGSDVGMPWMTPGASFHRELELLVEAGIPTKEVLKIATSGGSKFIYNSENVGTIKKNKIANMVVLNGNPLVDIRNTRKIELIIKEGEFFDSEKILNEIKQ